MDTRTLIWLFPIAFMFHDFEELILFEPWLRKNAPEIRARFLQRLPAFVARQIDPVLDKSAAEFCLPVGLIFGLTCLASYLALARQQYGFFLLASGAFFLHGFMHLAQALLLRRYIPAVATSLLVAIPYGLLLYRRLLAGGIIDLPGLLVYFLLAVVLTIPFILVMHCVGDSLYKAAVRLLVQGTA